MDITAYMRRYNKSLDFADYMYRNNQISECMTGIQPDDHSDFTVENIIWSTGSFIESVRKAEKNLVIWSEAEIKTYPTRLLSKAFARFICDVFGRNSCVFDVQVEKSGQVFNQGTTFIYNGLTRRYSEWDPDDGFEFSCIQQAFAENLEKDTAGTVVYRVASKSDFKMKPDAVRRLAEIGDRFGYDYVAYSTIHGSNCKYLQVKYEARFHNSEFELERFLYHVAPMSKKDRILRYGLCPKSQSFINGIQARHKDRVYLFNGYDESAIKSFIIHSGKTSKAFNRKTGSLVEQTAFALFKIDSRKIKNLNIYMDNMFQTYDKKHPTAVYTYSNIPPTSLEFIGEFKII